MIQQKQPMARVCGICTSPDQYSDVCPSLLEPRTTDHPDSLITHNNVGQNRPYVPPPIQQQRQQQVINNPPPAPNESSLEELVRQMTMQNIQFHKETRASIQRQESSIQNITTQMGQMATSLNTLQSKNSDKLPSQTMINPKNVSAITLRSGKPIELPTSTPGSALQKVNDIGRDIHASTPSSSATQQPPPIPLPFPPNIISSKKMEDVDKKR
ncbi:hypothetical protein Lal_00014523 [Lupinus albus]|nr:hypothetical protein Lal_00014523 [Lupinus albus]